MEDKLKVTTKHQQSGLPYYSCAKPKTTNQNDKRIIYIEMISESVLPVYNNGQCPLTKTCYGVTFNLSSAYVSSFRGNPG